MARRQFDELRTRFGLSEAPPVIFAATPQGKVWGLNALEPVAVEGELMLREDEAAAAFVDWLTRAYPGLVEAVTAAIAPAELALDAVPGEPLAGLGATEGGLLDKLLNAAQTVLPAYLQFEQQREVLDIQLERARAGLPPLDTGQYAPAVQIGLDRDTIARVADEAAARAAAGAGALFSSPWFWLVAAGGVGAVILLTQRRGRRR